MRDAADGSPTRPARRINDKIAACTVIFFVAAVTLGLSVHHEIQLTAEFVSPPWVNQATIAYQQEECLYHSIRASVPGGAAVYEINPDVGHAQLLAELSTLWAVPQEFRGKARWQLSIHAARGPLANRHRGHNVKLFDCFGTILTVRRL